MKQTHKETGMQQAAGHMAAAIREEHRAPYGTDGERMASLRQQYEAVSMPPEAVAAMKARMQQAKKEKAKAEKASKIKAMQRWGAAAAAALVLVALPNTSPQVAYAMGNLPVVGQLFQLVTVRDYQYEDEGHFASIQQQALQLVEPSEKYKYLLAVEEINSEVAALTQQYEADFRQQLRQEGYLAVDVSTELVQLTEQYVTLALYGYTSEASGSTEVHYYTIDLASGQRLTWSDLFTDKTEAMSALTDYLGQTMEASEEPYWYGDSLVDFDLQTAIEQAAFYINGDNQLVLVFQEGEVAPMSQGLVTFIIPAEVIDKYLQLS